MFICNANELKNKMLALFAKSIGRSLEEMEFIRFFKAHFGRCEVKNKACNCQFEALLLYFFS